MAELILLALGLTLGGLIVFLLLRKAGKAAPTSITVTTITDRVRAVGKLIGLEVNAKEIATSTKGFKWLPPLLLSQARVAMIFHFEKQYFVDLSRVGRNDVQELAPGRFRLRLPPIDGTLRLNQLEPYDIQAGRVLGLLDVIQVDAPTQKQLMTQAQDQAAHLYTSNDSRYRAEARSAIERQLSALLDLFDVDIEFEWSAKDESDESPEPVVLERTPREGSGLFRAAARRMLPVRLA